MADAPPAPKYATEFTCRMCGETKPVHYDWQRCWECYVAAQTKELRTIPGVCLACCLKNHQEQHRK
jgi:hypothetical protein